MNGDAMNDLQVIKILKSTEFHGNKIVLFHASWGEDPHLFNKQQQKWCFLIDFGFLTNTT